MIHPSREFQDAVSALCHGTANEEQVRTIETRAGVSFPADYRDFLLTQNGGYRHNR